MNPGFLALGCNKLSEKADSRPKGLNIRRRMPRGDHGFSLVELLIALVILALGIVPIINAVGPAVNTTAALAQISVATNQARATLNRLSSLDFASLSAHQGDPVDLTSLFGSAAEASLENFMFNGQLYTPAVAITDASGGAGGLLQLTVTIDPVRLTTLKADY